MTDECTITDEPFRFHPGIYEGLTEAEALAQVGTRIPTMPWEIPVLTPGCPIKGFWDNYTAENGVVTVEIPLHSRSAPNPIRMGFNEH